MAFFSPGNASWAVLDWPGILTAVSERLDRRRSAAMAFSMLYSGAVKTCRSEPVCCLTKVWKASALIRFRSEAAASVFEINRPAIKSTTALRSPSRAAGSLASSVTSSRIEPTGFLPERRRPRRFS